LDKSGFLSSSKILLLRPAIEKKKDMFEYLGLLGYWMEPIFERDSLREILIVMFSGLGLLIFGYLIKGMWGAITAFAIGTLIFLYSKHLLPF